LNLFFNGIEIKIATQYNEKKAKEKKNQQHKFQTKAKEVLAQKIPITIIFLIKRSKISNIPCMHIWSFPKKEKKKQTFNKKKLCALYNLYISSLFFHQV